MSLFAVFHVPASAFVLQETLRATPGTVVEIERAVTTGAVLTPDVWVTGGDREAFESAAEGDPSVEALRRLDEFDEVTLYRATWTGTVELIGYVCARTGVSILNASGRDEKWELEMRFDDRAHLDAFREFSREKGIPFRLAQLHELPQPQVVCQYGLTAKQRDALVAAWELGYYTSPEVTLSDVADELGISQQSVSQRLHRGLQSLLGQTLVAAPHRKNSRRTHRSGD